MRTLNRSSRGQDRLLVRSIEGAAPEVGRVGMQLRCIDGVSGVEFLVLPKLLSFDLLFRSVFFGCSCHEVAMSRDQKQAEKELFQLCLR